MYLLFTVQVTGSLNLYAVSKGSDQTLQKHRLILSLFSVHRMPQNTFPSDTNHTKDCTNQNLPFTMPCSVNFEHQSLLQKCPGGMFVTETGVKNSQSTGGMFVTETGIQNSQSTGGIFVTETGVQNSQSSLIQGLHC